MSSNPSQWHDSMVFTDLKSDTEPKLSWGDYAVVIGYFVIIIATGIWAMYQSNRSTVSGYFLAGRFMTWLPVGLSVFASNIGSEHFIGLAGSAAAAGIAVGAFEVNALILLQLAGWVFLPVFVASKVCTLPEYISKRFGGSRIQVYLALLSLLLYIFTKISVNLFSGAIFINQMIGWNIYVSIAILLGVTALCTVTGGLTAVMYTEVVQSMIVIGGASYVAVTALSHVGGFTGLIERYPHAIAAVVPLNKTQCALPRENAFQLLRSLDDPEMPWLGFLLGQTPGSIWYWCADQMMVQRLLASKSLSHAKGGTLLAGYLKILPLFLMIIPGMISRVLFANEVACVDPLECERFCDNEAGCTNIAYPRLVLGIMGSPWKGLIMSVMLAALMSDLSSIFNSSSTLFTCDIWPRIRKKATVLELMIVGRSFVVVMIGISIAWVPIVQSMQNAQLYIYIQDVASNLSPPIAAVYILAVLFKRVNEPGAFWALLAGLVVGLARMITNIVYTAPECGIEDSRPWIVRLHYLYFAIFLFWMTVAICGVVSYFTAPPDEYLLIRTTFWSRHSDEERIDEKIDLKVTSNGSMEDIDIDSPKPRSASTQSKNNAATVLVRFASWFCGIKFSKSGSDDVAEEKVGAEGPLVSSIEQALWEKIILNIILVIIVSLGVFIFVFFSLSNWTEFIVERNETTTNTNI